jgi:protoporphyrinogen oxidase
MAHVEGLLPPSQWLTRDKVSRIYINGHFLDYPPSPLALARVFGSTTFFRMTANYAIAKLTNLFGRREPTTFEDDLSSRVGRGLYEILLKPIALKLWGDPRNIDVKLSRGRVQTPSLLEITAQTLGLRKSSAFEVFTFRYPAGGPSELWNSIRRRTEHRGEFLLEHSVTGFDVESHRVTAIRCKRRDQQEVVIPLRDDDFIASTLPLGMLIRVLGNALPPDAARIAQNMLILNDLLLVFLHVDQPSLFPEAWIFVPDENIAFHRISEQESFDPAMTPNGSVVCCEIMSNELRDMSARSDQDLTDAAVRGLHHMGYNGWRLLAARVIRLPKSYPVFRPGFEKALAEILGYMDAFTNLRTVGRQGAFNYIGTLDAMDIGYGFARWLKQGQTTGEWRQERERTSHYPVLD